MDETWIMGFTLPFRSTTALVIRDRGIGKTCLVLDKASAVHLGHQIIRPLHVPREQFVRMLRW